MILKTVRRHKSTRKANALATPTRRKRRKSNRPSQPNRQRQAVVEFVGAWLQAPLEPKRRGRGDPDTPGRARPKADRFDTHSLDLTQSTVGSGEFREVV